MHSPELSETSAPLRPARLWMLALASLMLSAVVQIAVLFVEAKSATLDAALGNTGSMYVQLVVSIVSALALLSAVAPAMLAEGHRLFRYGLVAAHLLVGWAIQTGSVVATFPFDAELVAGLASANLLGLLRLFAGLWAGLRLLAMIFGWTITRRVDGAERPTLSLQGMLMVTAAAALLFASPRLITPALKWATRRILTPDSNGYRSSNMVGFESAMGESVIPLISAAVGGFLLAIFLASAMWCRRSRLGCLGVALGTVAVALLVVISIWAAGGPFDSLGRAVAAAVAFLVGSSLATLHTAVWHGFGWRLVRIRRRPTISGSTGADSTAESAATPDGGAAE